MAWKLTPYCIVQCDCECRGPMRRFVTVGPVGLVEVVDSSYATRRTVRTTYGRTPSPSEVRVPYLSVSSVHASVVRCRASAYDYERSVAYVLRTYLVYYRTNISTNR
jgi:hypothetical protein